MVQVIMGRALCFVAREKIICAEKIVMEAHFTPTLHLYFHFAFVFTLKLIAILTQPRLYSR